MSVWGVLNSWQRLYSRAEGTSSAAGDGDSAPTSSVGVLMRRCNVR